MIRGHRPGLELIRFAADVSARCVRSIKDEISKHIGITLMEMGELIDVDRAYVRLIDSEAAQYVCTHEWFKAGIIPLRDSMRTLSMPQMSWLTRRLTNSREFCLTRIEDLPADADGVRRVLLEGGGRSLVAVPMACGGKVLGYLGVETLEGERSWFEEEVQLLKITANAFANALSRRPAEESSEHPEPIVERPGTGRVNGKETPVIPQTLAEHGNPFDQLSTLEERLNYLSYYDPLTNIPNRVSLVESLKRAVGRAAKGDHGALLLIDVDNFKLLNETLGHRAGDEILVDLVKILRTHLREGDFLARLGGDEFAVLLPATSKEGAYRVAEKLRHMVEAQEVFLNAHGVSTGLTISIGVVMLDGTVNSQKVLSYADAGLYAAKEEGRNRVHFVEPGQQDILVQLAETNEIIALIRSALKMERFVLMFQRIVDVSTGQVRHHEALLRLVDETGQMISPGRFIPVAERFGLMSQVDHWVVRESLRALQRYPALKVFVNISGANLGDKSLLERIEAHIRQSGVDPTRIGFEITETTAVKDLLLAERWILRLKRLGCQFALDDFGIGFSSFTYLRMLPVDYLKIDGSYVRNIDTDSTHCALVQAMNTVAHTLDKMTVAEFVESGDILRVLQEVGVDYGQGYFIGKPSQVPEGLGAYA